MHGSKYAWLLVAVVLFGCNQSSSPTSVAESQDAADTSVAPTADAATSPTQDPKTVVEMFLTSLREGDDMATSQLLTQKARRETARHDMVVRPPGSQTAQFVVGEVIYTTANHDIAHVESNWTDVDDAGRRQTYEIVWILRKEAVGWAVAGMATELFSGEAPLVMNFEDPVDMLAQQQRAELELTRRGQLPASTSEVMPASHSTPVR